MADEISDINGRDSIDFVIHGGDITDRLMRSCLAILTLVLCVSTEMARLDSGMCSVCPWDARHSSFRKLINVASTNINLASTNMMRKMWGYAKEYQRASAL